MSTQLEPIMKCGERLAELRKAAGLSQRRLAQLLGVHNSDISFWEHSNKPPRSELLSKLAEILDVSVVELLDTTPVEEMIKRKGGPTGKLRRVFEKACQLPRHQQDKIVEVVTVFLSQYEQQNEQNKSISAS